MSEHCVNNGSLALSLSVILVCVCFFFLLLLFVVSKINHPLSFLFLDITFKITTNLRRMPKHIASSIQNNQQLISFWRNISYKQKWRNQWKIHHKNVHSTPKRMANYARIYWIHIFRLKMDLKFIERELFWVHAEREESEREWQNREWRTAIVVGMKRGFSFFTTK